MLRKVIKNYYKLFDEKINNWSVIVLIIWFMIAWVWNIANWYETTFNYAKANTIESKIELNQYIKVNWKTYKLVN